MAISGSAISLMRSTPHSANHNFNGSTLGEDIVCISLNSSWVFATSVFRILPSLAGIFKALQFVTV